MAQSVFARRGNITAFMIFIAALLVTLLAATSWAEKRTGPCYDDVEKFCKDVHPGRGNMAECLKEHEPDLSPGCRERMVAGKQGRREFREACKDDVSSFCKDMKPGGGRIINCLKEHENELSPHCKEMMEKNTGPR